MKKTLIVLASLFCLSTSIAEAGGYHYNPPSNHHHHYHDHYYDRARTRDYMAFGLGMASVLSNHILASRQMDMAQQQIEMMAQANSYRQNQNGTVYWCECEKGFYPQVRACPSGWKALPVN